MVFRDTEKYMYIYICALSNSCRQRIIMQIRCYNPIVAKCNCNNVHDDNDSALPPPPPLNSTYKTSKQNNSNLVKLIVTNDNSYKSCVKLMFFFSLELKKTLIWMLYLNRLYVCVCVWINEPTNIPATLLVHWPVNTSDWVHNILQRDHTRPGQVGWLLPAINHALVIIIYDNNKYNTLLIVT